MVCLGHYIPLYPVQPALDVSLYDVHCSMYVFRVRTPGARQGTIMTWSNENFRSWEVSSIPPILTTSAISMGFKHAAVLAPVSFFLGER